ncbi:MAG: TIGR02556 family CRISPR-associated protein [Tepidanaerobacteraceae bacterium]
MLTAIRDIGAKVLGDSDDQLLDSLTIDIELRDKEKTGFEQLIIIVKFDTTSHSISFESRKLREDSPKRFLWVGNASGPSSFQWLATTNNLGFLCSQTLPSLYDRLHDKSPLKQKIRCIINNCFTSFSEDIGKRYRNIWDLDKLGIKENFDPLELEKFLREESKKKNVKFKEQKLVAEVAKIIDQYIRKQLFLDKNDEIVLYTIKIDDEFICNHADYKHLIYQDKVGEIFEESKEAICSVCGIKQTSTPETKRMDFKYYNTDKISFSSGITGKFDKNYVLCEECYKGTLAGESYIKNHMGTRIGRFALYVIPDFLFGVELDSEQMAELSEQIVYSFNSAVTYDGLEKFLDKVDEFKELENLQDNYVLNLLFHDSGGASQQFKVLKLIKDVSPSRIRKMRIATSRVHDVGNKLFGDSKAWAIELNKIYHLIPLRMRRNDILEPAKLLEVYDAIFSKNPVSKEFLIEKFVELASVYRLNRFNVYNTRAPKMDSDVAYDTNLVWAMLQANLCILYLAILDNLQGGEPMSTENLTLSDDLKEYIEVVKYGEQETAMFLLGYLVAEVARAQYKEGLSRKPILDKIAFQGMNKNKLVMLTTEIFEKLKQYKVLGYDNEKIFAQFKMLLHKNIGDWKLNDVMNVFYILSGYSYRTYQILTKSKTEVEEND